MCGKDLARLNIWGKRTRRRGEEKEKQGKKRGLSERRVRDGFRNR